MAPPSTRRRRDRASLGALRRHPLAGDDRIVLLGEAGDDTPEFYRERTRITKRLIRERGFTAVAIEGDWPDADRVNRYICGARNDSTAEEALRGFQRSPAGTRDAEVLDLVEWLRTHNDGMHRSARKVGFYGLALDKPDSLDRLLAHLDRHGGTARVVVWAKDARAGEARGRPQPTGVRRPPASPR
jgi:erythromycin esterase-like protein